MSTILLQALSECHKIQIFIVQQVALLLEDMSGSFQK